MTQVCLSLRRRRRRTAGTGDKNLLGGKGANLAEMASIGLPVPPGFTISTEMCARYLRRGRAVSRCAARRGRRRHSRISKASTGKSFGDAADPLLVSVRSGARVSMPGMMDTVLNLGLNDATVAGLAAASGDARFAWDSYRRFIQMYADVVLGLDHGAFEEALEIAKEDKGFYLDTELTADDWQALVAAVQGAGRASSGASPSRRTSTTSCGARSARCSARGSRSAPRSIAGSTTSRPTGAPRSTSRRWCSATWATPRATGVAFTRDPAKGDKRLLRRVPDQRAGRGRRRRHPHAAISDQGRARDGRRQAAVDGRGDARGLTPSSPACSTCSKRIIATCRTSSSRSSAASCGCSRRAAGKRTAKAALKIAVDMAEEGLITRRARRAGRSGGARPVAPPDARSQGGARRADARACPPSPGAASGAVVFDADTAEKRADGGDAVILVRIETSPEDIHGMHAARGILTARGGMTSHAAVVARGMGRPCVSGAGSALDRHAKAHDAHRRARGERGRRHHASTARPGEVMAGEVPTVAARTGRAISAR